MNCVLTSGAPCIGLVEDDGWEASLRLDLLNEDAAHLTVLFDGPRQYRPDDAVLSNAAGEIPLIAASTRKRDYYDETRQPHVPTNHIFEVTLPVELDGTTVAVPVVPGRVVTDEDWASPGAATISFKTKGD